MRLLTLLICSLIALHAASLEWSRSFDRSLQQSKAQEKPLLLYLCMPGCGTCRFMDDEVFTDSEVKAYIRERFVYAKLFAGDETLPKELQVPMAPVFHFIDPRNGERIDTIIGGKKSGAFLETLRNITDAYNNPEGEER